MNIRSAQIAHSALTIDISFHSACNRFEKCEENNNNNKKKNIALSCRMCLTGYCSQIVQMVKHSPSNGKASDSIPVMGNIFTCWFIKKPSFLLIFLC